MKIIKHPSCTHSLGAPSDMQDGSCRALPVRYDETEHGTFAVSFWKPESEDLALLAAGGVVTLHVRASGRQHPVVSVSTLLDNPEPGFGDVFGQLQAANQRLEELATAHQVLAAANQKTIREQQLVLIELREAPAACERRAAIAEAQLQLADALRNRERGLPPDVLTVQAEARIADWEGGRGIVTEAPDEPK